MKLTKSCNAWHRLLSAWRIPGLLILLLLPIAVGCAAVRVTDPARTATEQFLMTEAVSRAIEQLSADALRDKQIYIDSAYLGPIEQPFVQGQLRAKLLMAGARLVSKREEAKVIVEVRAGSVGIDRHDYLLGIPAITIPGMTTSTGGLTYVTPELAIVKNQKQRGFASVAFVAYWAATGELITSSGPFVGRTRREDYWFLGTGPRTVGDIPSTERPK